MFIYSGLGDKEKIFMTSWVSLNAGISWWHFPAQSVWIVNAYPILPGTLEELSTHIACFPSWPQRHENYRLPSCDRHPNLKSQLSGKNLNLKELPN